MALPGEVAGMPPALAWSAMASGTRIRRILARLAQSPPIGHWEPALVHAALWSRSREEAAHEGSPTMEHGSAAPTPARAGAER